MPLETATDNYKKVLLQYFEEEIMGEAYFYKLAEHFPEAHQKEKMVLMAEVERYAAEAVRPLLEKYALTPRTDDELGPEGGTWVIEGGMPDWPVIIADIAERYIDYIADFEALENMAPEEDRPLLKILTDHEFAAIEFGKLEVAKAAESAAPLQRYLETGKA